MNDTLPRGWYRVASLSSLVASNRYRQIAHRLGETLLIKRARSGEITVTSDAGKRQWPVHVAFGQIFIAYQTSAAPPPWPKERAFPVWRSFYQHVRGNLCLIGENGADSSHFAVVHHRTIRAASMRTETTPEGHLLLAATMRAFFAGIPHDTLTRFFSPGCAAVELSPLGLELRLLLMFTPIDRDHTEAFYLVAAPRLLGLGHLAAHLMRARLGPELAHDIPIWENLVWQERPMLLKQEEAIPAFRRWYKGFTAPARTRRLYRKSHDG